MMSSVKIYLGNVPAMATKDEIQRLFLRMGIEVGVKMFYKSGGQTPHQLNRGYCHITVDSPEAANEVLNGPPIHLNGYKLSPSEYKKGKQLKESNEENNNKRLIIKNVPHDVSEAEIKQRVEEFGSAEQVYFFSEKHQPGLPSQYPSGRKYNTASVQFATIASAKLCLESKMLVIGGAELPISQYLSKYDRKSKSKLPFESQTSFDSYQQPSHSQHFRPVTTSLESQASILHSPGEDKGEGSSPNASEVRESSSMMLKEIVGDAPTLSWRMLFASVDSNHGSDNLRINYSLRPVVFNIHQH